MNHKDDLIKDFYAQLDSLEQACAAGQISQSRLATEATILGWQWHHDTGSQLPPRPVSTLRSGVWYGVFRFKQAGHYPTRDAVSLHTHRPDAVLDCNRRNDLCANEPYCVREVSL